MLRGFYTAASGMITQQRHQEALGNNMANMNTPGYKADQATIRSFPEMLLQAQGKKQLPVNRNANLRINETIGSMNTGVYVQEFVPDFAQGDIQETTISTDLAITQGEVPDETGGIFFRVQNEAGEERLTRNGNFTVDGNGFLVTNQGYYVLNSAGAPIETGGRDFTVTNAGLLQMDTETIQLGLAYTADVNELTKEGDNLYNGEAGAMPADARFAVQQGFLEGSNVDGATTMTDQLNAYRMFELNQRVLRAYDESLGKTVSEIGRLG
ncbi:flagellar hook-basal body protein [Oceanobacillus alkalisoli]|uniref:flagellar hook-basal body protein n=1 Tax=Oceanobacillus alkalisoli TaxID=2925113 RepID=UPI001EEFBBCD|nr:flagellar hook-basal body protein [Oceanobacillus alkalisoli]MCF3942721.1 flagellar hook-basal body protein [Oceanobacillus alkalisoli]MCG5102693.1 flagellar hook-basal body protein [Oceanobacillus alkalisoli]